MHIVLAGGWGYGNLGDEVILVSTLKLLAMRYPSAQITVLTYRVDDAVRIRFPSVNFVRALHGYVDKDAAAAFYRFLDARLSLLGLLRRKVWHSLLERNAFLRARVVSRFQDSVQGLIKDCDLFVVGGGGYLNDDWRSNVECNLAQLSVAIKNNVPIAFCGPGLGHFNDERIRKKLFGAITSAKKVWVRDVFSANDIAAVRSDLSLIEDVALTDFSSIRGGERVEVIGVVVNKVNNQLFESLSSSFEAVFGERVRVKLLLSRRWQGDLRAVGELDRRLREKGICATTVVPGDCFSLEEEISSCSLVISENLHGLIVAVRNGVQVVAVNDYEGNSPNGRKFVAFMEQLDAQDFVLKSTMQPDMVGAVLERARVASQDPAESGRKLAFCRGVKHKADLFFDTLFDREGRQ